MTRGPSLRVAARARNSRFAVAIARAGYTQETFAKALGVKRSAVAAWVGGVSVPLQPRHEAIRDLLRISEAALDEILDEPRRGAFV
jgi:transcriptional regulator with XRE-family HTH domain